jgi:hypothetical protein
MKSRSAPHSTARTRRLWIAASTLLLAGVGLAMAPACVESESKFYIAAPAGLKVSDGGAVCSTDDTEVCSGLAVTPGGSVGCFKVVSGLIPRARNDTNHAETNRIILSEVDVEVINSSGATVDSFTSPTNGIVDPTTPETTNFTTVPMPIVRAESISKLAAGERFVIGLVLKGRTTGGLDIETPEFFLAAEAADAACPADKTCCATD